MSQIRVSIPFVGGLTKVYEGDEFKEEVNMLKEKAIAAGCTVACVTGLGVCKVLEVVANTSADAHDSLLKKVMQWSTVPLKRGIAQAAEVVEMTKDKVDGLIFDLTL